MYWGYPIKYRLVIGKYYFLISSVMVPSRLSDLLAADLHILLKRKQELRTEGRDELLSPFLGGTRKGCPKDSKSNQKMCTQTECEISQNQKTYPIQKKQQSINKMRNKAKSKPFLCFFLVDTRKNKPALFLGGTRKRKTKTVLFSLLFSLKCATMKFIERRQI